MSPVRLGYEGYRMVSLNESEAPAAPLAAAKMSIETPKLTVEQVDNHVYFYAHVDSDRCLALIRTIRELDGRLRNEYASRALPEDYPATPIWLHVNSYGGYLFDAMAIVDQIQRIKTPVFSIVEGCTASAATLITMSCDRRYIMPSSFMLIHQLSTITWGTYEQIKDEMKLLDQMMETLVAFYAERSKLSADDVRGLLEHDSWFNARECVERGLADSLL